jgi:endonuclease YncB( thermonuclease family)
MSIRRPPSNVSSIISVALLAAGLLVLAACGPQQAPPAPRPSLRDGPAANAGRPPEAQQAARSIRVQDGDSFVARLGDGRRMTIRLSGIDAPEQSQPFASVSRRHLLELIEGRDLQLRVAKHDQYGRAVAQVFVMQADGPLDAGLAQLQAGLAWYYRHYRDDLPAAAREPYAAAEEAARRAHRGLWQATAPQPPWEYRRRGRENGEGGGRGGGREYRRDSGQDSGRGPVSEGPRQ